MKKIIFGTSLFVACVAAGCGNSQLHQSLLLHENRQLEDALYATRTQVADLQRENCMLRTQQGSEFPKSPGRDRHDSWDEDVNLIPPVEMPRIFLPSESGTTDVPDSLRGSQMIPVWTPKRTLTTKTLEHNKE